MIANNQQKSWNLDFVGRDNDLAWLKKRWEEAKSGEPQLAILKGETGLGKTRIIQEFYKYLSAKHDPNQYWPKELETGANLSLNPDAGTFRTTKKTPIPWLWWGIDFQEKLKDSSDSQPNGITREIHHLKLHMEKLLNLRKANREQLKRAAELVIKIALHVDYITLPVELFEWILDAGGEFLALHKEKDERKKTQYLRAREECQKQIKNILELLGFAIGRTFPARPAIPLVLVLDNVHWIDAFSLDVIRQIVQKFAQQATPLFIVATTWHYEFEVDSRVDSSMNMPERNFATLSKAWAKSSHLKVSELEIGPLEEKKAVKDIDEQLKAIFPGLTKSERRKLIGKPALGSGEVCHNLGLLVESVRQLQLDHHRCFDPSTRRLTTLGKQSLDEVVKKVDRYQLVMRRFMQLNETAGVIGAATVQGFEFFPEIVRAIASTVFPKEPAPQEMVAQSLQYGHQPVGFITLEDKRAYFNQTLNYRVAADYLQQMPKQQQNIQRETRKVVGELLAQGDWKKLDSKVKLPFLRLAVSKLSISGKKPTGTGKDSPGSKLKALWLEAAIALIMEVTNGPTPLQASDLVRQLAETTTATELVTYAIRDDDSQAHVESLVGWFISIGPADLAETVMSQVDKHRRLQLVNSLNDPTAWRRCAAASERLGDVKFQRGTHKDIIEAQKLYRDALQHRREVLRGFPADVERWNDLVFSLSRLGHLKLNAGAGSDPMEARSIFGEATQLAKEALQLFPSTVGLRLNLAGSLNEFADAARLCQTPTGLKEADVAYGQALQICREVLPLDEEAASVLQEIAQAQRGLAAVKMGYGKPSLRAQALEFLDQAMETTQELIKQHGRQPERWSYVGVTHFLIAGVQQSLAGESYEHSAQVNYQKAVDIARKVIDHFGETVPRLQRLSWALDGLAELEQKIHSRNVGSDREAVAIRSRLSAAYGQTLEELATQSRAARSTVPLREYRGLYDFE